MSYDPASSPYMEEDEFDYGSVHSLASTAHDMVEEHGRRYPNYRYGSSPFPRGDHLAEENESALYNLTYKLYRGRLFLAPVEQPQNVLDVRCGQSGLWAKSMADTYPDAQITGMDVTTPRTEGQPNLEFCLQNFNDEWILDEVLQVHGKFDFIYAKSLFGSSQDFPTFYKRCFDNLAPGGYFEQCEIAPNAECDDGVYKKDNIIQSLCHLIPDIEKTLNTDYNIATGMKELIERAGFIDVQERRIRAPWSPWPPPGTHEHEVGEIFQKFYETGLQGWMVAPLCRFYKFTPSDVDTMCTAAIIELRANDQHFCSDHITIIARKPLDAPAD